MPLPASYIKSITAPVWNTLTAAQRSAWHTFASSNPIRNSLGELTIVNGWQMFNHVNAWLAVTNPSLMLADPPSDLEIPAPINLPASIWPIKLKQPDSSTFRQGRAFLLVNPPIPANRIIAVIQASAFVSRFSLNPWPRAKSNFIPPGFSGLYDLTQTTGFQSSNTEGLNRKRIIGPWAAKHPQDRVAKLVIISTENGMRTEGSILNSKL